MHILDLSKQVGESLTRLDPQGSQLMFESIALSPLLDIILKFASKRDSICELMFCFCPADPISRLQLLKAIKEKLGQNVNQ